MSRGHLMNARAEQLRSQMHESEIIVHPSPGTDHPPPEVRKPDKRPLNLTASPVTSEQATNLCHFYCLLHRCAPIRCLSESHVKRVSAAGANSQPSGSPGAKLAARVSYGKMALTLSPRQGWCSSSPRSRRRRHFLVWPVIDSALWAEVFPAGCVFYSQPRRLKTR